MVVRIVGSSPDAQLADHLYQSIRQEVGLAEKDPTTTADGHWTERLASQLAKDKHLTLLLAGIDRLDSWGLVSVDKLPDNIRLIVTCSTLPKDGLRSGWMLVQWLDRCSLPVSWTSHPILSPLLVENPGHDAILNGFFDQIEQLFPIEMVRQTCAALNLASQSGGLTPDELASCLQHVSTGDNIQQHLTPLIQSLGIKSLRKEKDPI